jgi:predicted DNA-binding transcriptional regulator AlpA
MQAPNQNSLVLPIDASPLAAALAPLIEEAVANALARAKPAEQPAEASIPIAERILRLTETCLIAGVSRWTIADLERAGKFPQRVEISDTVFGYRGDEVLAWRDSRPRTKPA